MTRKVSNIERSVLRAALSRKGWKGKSPSQMNGSEALQALKTQGVNVLSVLEDARSEAVWHGNVEKATALQMAMDAERNGGDIVPLDMEAELNAALQEKVKVDNEQNDDVAAALDVLQAALGHGKGLTVEEVERIVDAKVQAAVIDFAKNAAVVQRIEVVDRGEVKHVEGFMHEKQALLMKAAGSRNKNGKRKNIALTGPRGSGKSQAARIVAQGFDCNFYMHGAMEYRHEVMGSVHPLTDVFRDTQFVKCYTEGGVVLLDELDRWDSNATTALNGALADDEIWLDNGECVKRHPDCLIICAMNTKGTGPDAEYVGANKLDAAFLDRFATMIEWNVDLKLEEAIVGNADVLKNVRKARAQVARYGIDMEITPRMAIDMADHVASGFTVEEAAEITYLARMSDDQKEMVLS